MQSQDDFLKRVKDVLAHLYGYSYLQTHPLADELEPGNRLSARERMRFLRTTILQAIDELNPGPKVPLRSLRARAYGVLNLHYVEGLTIQGVARELAISERQVYRDLRKAERSLATLLWADRPRASRGSQQAVSRLSRAALVRQEAERARGQTQEVCVRTLLEGVIAAVGRLAQQHGIRLEFTVAPDLDTVYTDRQITRQALVSTLSQAAQRARSDTVIAVAAEPHGSGTQIRIEFTPQPRGKDSEVFPLVARQLVSRLGGKCSSQVHVSGRVSLAFTLEHRARITVLVIDDNAGLAELFRRYLVGEEYQLISATDGGEGLRLAEEDAPDIVVLDVMMPQQDGWEILQYLQNQESTRHIPVIICSVLDDPELAHSLGASDFLSKPVSRTQLLSSLARCWRDSRFRSHPTSPSGI